MLDNLTNSELGKNIKYYRKSRGLKQRELACLVGISVSRLCFYERGNSSLRYNTLLKISEVLNIRVELLVDRVQRFIQN